MNIASFSGRAALAVGLLSLVAACGDSGAAPGAVAAPPAMPPSAVSFLTVTPERLAITNELPGRIAPTRIAEVRPRISGIVVERVFEQGSFVKSGDVLYRIDPALFQVQVDSAEASLQGAKAAQLQARQQADRQNTLRDRNIASQQALDNAAGALAQADANVAAAAANLAAAELNLQYTEVRAPISGRIGRALITEGALVSANSAENLATIQQLNPVYADFTQPSSELIRLRQALESGALVSDAEGEAEVTVRLDDGSNYAHTGKLLFSESSVDATTGQVTMRAEVPNPDDDLLPGLYVRVLIEQGVENEAIAVPQQAVQRDTGGNSQLYVIKDDNTVELRTVQVGRPIGNRYVIESGLQAGERVVVEGFQKIRPGAPVSPQEWAPASAEAAAPSTAG